MPCDCAHWRRPDQTRIDAGDETDAPGCQHPEVTGETDSAVTLLGCRVQLWLYKRQGACPGRVEPARAKQGGLFGGGS